MINRKNRPEYARDIKRLAAILILAWTMAVGGSLVWNYYRQRNAIKDLIRNETKTAFDKDVMYRLWNAGHGGLYLAKPIDHRELTRIIGKYLPSKQDVSSQAINSATAQASDPERLCSERISYQPQTKVKQL
jgi:hypothetical protein